jgi:pimeloyl-ACP methyl ester carboxylesterase
MTERVQPTSKFATLNGLSLHYLEWGKAGRPIVVCVHGYTSSAQAFNALARHLQDRFFVVAMDVRGHGTSGWSPTGAYQYADQASDLATPESRRGWAKTLSCWHQ